MPRQCGACTACCTTLVIEALDKPAFTRCPHDCAGGCGSGGAGGAGADGHDGGGGNTNGHGGTDGCGDAHRDVARAVEATGGCDIYDTRPNGCRNFRCFWLDGHLGDGDRPDQLGVLMTTTTHDDLGTFPMIVEARAGAADSPAVRSAIQRFTQATPVLVLTAEGGKLHHRQPTANKVTAPSAPSATTAHTPTTSAGTSKTAGASPTAADAKTAGVTGRVVSLPVLRSAA